MGPLSGITIIEFAGIGPGPFCAMMLSDMGARVIRIDRKGAVSPPAGSGPTYRGRASIGLDLKHPSGLATAQRLIDDADALLEGFRPGVMEKLGLGPDACLKRNPQLVFGRMTGWGQTGPLAKVAGHDINYIALTGALHAIGLKNGAPVPPLNLVGDYGGGGMFLAFGVVCALLEARQSGRGQVVDAAMIDGTATLMSVFFGLAANGHWQDERGVNMLDGGAHFYGCYECADAEWIAIGAIEPQFYALLLEQTEIDDPEFKEQMNKDKWSSLRDKLAAVIKTKTSDEWRTIMEGSDVCFAPVLSLADTPKHPHHQARQTFITHEGMLQPAPAPRFSRTPGQIQSAPVPPGNDNRQVLEEFGFSAREIDALETNGAI